MTIREFQNFAVKSDLINHERNIPANIQAQQILQEKENLKSNIQKENTTVQNMEHTSNKNIIDIKV